MKNLLKNCGLLLVLLGVICILVYAWAMPSNGLLIASLVLEVIGILTYILVNQKME